MADDTTRGGRTTMHNANELKIGLFGANCSSGRAVTTAPQRWSGSWEDNLRLARLADERGIDFMLPVARWRPYGPVGDYQSETLETITWAAGLLGATERITVFGTVHALLFNPIIAAKQMVTADQIGHGRFGLNLVVGWNEGEFKMFGVDPREHQDRYAYAQEWLDAIKRIWGPEENFTFDGEFIRLGEIRAHPKPYGNTQPVIMNAGQSDTGRDFAMRNCDAFFSVTGTTIEEQGENVRAAKALAAQSGNTIEVYTIGVVTCRATQKEAEEYHRYAIEECADWTSVDEMLAMRGITPDVMSADEFEAARREAAASGMGGWKMVGDPDLVAGELARLASVGIRGVGMSLINYLDELPFFCDEVLPRLARMGLRSG